jgi:DNA-binding transcriptional LysR family regulator
MSELLQMRAFSTAVGAGGFAAAGRQLGLTRSQVSKLVQALEQRLGVSLLVRTSRALALTDAGREYHERVADILARVAEAELSLAGRQLEPQGPLRVNAPMTFGLRRIAPLVSAFLERHPKVTVDLHLDDRILDPLEGGFDVTVRVAALGDSSLVARRLCAVPRVLCAAPAYLALRGTPARPEELRDHDCLHYGYLAGGSEWSLQRAGEAPAAVPVRGRLCSNNGEALQQAALAGSGIALLPRFVVEADLAAGRLVEVLGGWSAPPIAAHALYLRAPRVPAKVRAFVEHLVARLASAAAPAGTPPAAPAADAAPPPAS